MPSQETPTAEDYIHALNINGLSGRMLKAPATKRGAKREILLLYGHHALLERCWGLVQNLQEYGPVTMPDLPGFGGMTSFLKIGRKPSIDNYADYLAAYVKMQYKKRPLTIIGISFGFVVATRMLQRYPDMAKRVNLLVSVVGFMHHDDFLFSPLRQRIYRRVTRLFGTRPMALVIRYGGLNRFFIRNIYVNLPSGKRRMLEMEPTEFNTLIDFEIKLWQTNDVRTHWLTTSEFFKLDNCWQKIDLPVWHVAASHDHYFNNHFVEQHMRIVFTHYQQGIMPSLSHIPSILGDKDELAVMLPPEIRKALKKKL